MPSNCEIHSYQRSPYNKEVYRCIKPTCSHYQKKGYLLGKEALCTKCDEPFILTREQLRNKNTVCVACSRSPKAVEAEAAKRVMDDILSKINVFDENEKSKNSGDNA